LACFFLELFTFFLKCLNKVFSYFWDGILDQCFVKSIRFGQKKIIMQLGLKIFIGFFRSIFLLNSLRTPSQIHNMNQPLGVSYAYNPRSPMRAVSPITENSRAWQKTDLQFSNWMPYSKATNLEKMGFSNYVVI